MFGVHKPSAAEETLTCSLDTLVAGGHKNCLASGAKIIMVDNNKHVVRCLMIDFPKTFHTVNHAILMKKLVEYGLDQNAIEWVLSFLSDRTQFTEVGTKISGRSQLTYLSCNALWKNHTYLLFSLQI